MATAKEREQFIALMVRDYPEVPLHIAADTARKILRLARTHGNLAVEQCNGPAWGQQYGYNPKPGEWEAWEDARTKREASCERRITKLCAPFGIVPRFGGDPRGYTVKLQLPSGAHNTWGGREEGYGVPQ